MDVGLALRANRGWLGFLLGALLAAGALAGASYAQAYVDDYTGETLEAKVQAGAALNASAGDPGNVTVTWTANQNADDLLVRVEGPATVSGPTTAQAVVLGELNESVTFAETGATDEGQTVEVVAVAREGDDFVGEDGRNEVVIVKRSVTL